MTGCRHRFDDAQGRRVYSHCQSCGDPDPLYVPQYVGDAGVLDVLRDGLKRLDADAQRWLTESDDRPNLRAAAARIRKLLALVSESPT